MAVTRIAAAERSDVSAPLLSVLFLPAPKSALVQDGLARPAQDGQTPDIVVLTETNAALLISERAAPAQCAVLPIVDASPTSGHPASMNGKRADISVPCTPAGMRDALAMSLPMVERARRLPARLLNSHAPERLLLARLFVRERGLVPCRDPNVPATFRYPDEEVVPNAGRVAHALSEAGYMETRLIDCVSVCPNCESARLCAREVCGRCRAPDLSELAIVHHFRCAYQATEDEFAAAPNPVCPKCRRALEYFGVDHDRPGSVVKCRRCNFVSGESLASFLCLDCGVDTSSEQVGSLPINAYEPTPAGIRWAANDAIVPELCGPGSASSRLLEFAHFASANAAREHSVLSILLSSPREHPNDRLYRGSFSLLTTLLREAFRPDVDILDDPPIFFVLLPNEGKGEWEAALPALRERLERHMQLGDSLFYRVYGGHELLALASAYARIRYASWRGHVS